MRIYKYQMRSDKASFLMPKGAKIVHCDNQNNYVTLWALHDEDAPLEERKFEFFPTGVGVDVEGVYIATVLCLGGAYVWHVFEQSLV